MSLTTRSSRRSRSSVEVISCAARCNFIRAWTKSQEEFTLSGARRSSERGEEVGIRPSLRGDRFVRVLPRVWMLRQDTRCNLFGRCVAPDFRGVAASALRSQWSVLARMVAGRYCFAWAGVSWWGQETAAEGLASGPGGARLGVLGGLLVGWVVPVVPAGKAEIGGELV